MKLLTGSAPLRRWMNSTSISNSTPTPSILEPPPPTKKTFSVSTTSGPGQPIWPKERPNPSCGELPAQGADAEPASGGHHHRNWAIDGYRQLVLNTIAWIAGEKVPPSGVPTYPVSEDELNEKLDDYGDKTNRVKLPTKGDITFTPGPWMTPEEHAESRRKPKKKKK